MNSLLDNVEDKISKYNQGPEVIDRFGVKPGRKKRIASTHEKLCCLICDAAHSTDRCPHRQDVLKYIPIGLSKDGTKHCSLCKYSGHYVKNCPALIKWRQLHLKQNENQDCHKETQAIQETQAIPETQAIQEIHTQKKADKGGADDDDLDFFL